MRKFFLEITKQKILFSSGMNSQHPFQLIQFAVIPPPARTEVQHACPCTRTETSLCQGPGVQYTQYLGIAWSSGMWER